MMISDLKDAMVSEYNNNESLQQTVRDYAAECYENGETDQLVASGIAVAVGMYRKAMQGSIDASDDPKGVRKRVNNVANDVSRLCRELTGKTIVCTSRKSHTYEPRDPKPREPKSESKTSPVTPKQIEEVTQGGAIIDVMRGLLTTHGEDAFLEAAREVVSEIKTHREAA